MLIRCWLALATQCCARFTPILLTLAWFRYDTAELLVRLHEHGKDDPRYFSVEGCVTNGSSVNNATNRWGKQPKVPCKGPAVRELDDVGGGLFHANLLTHCGGWQAFFEGEAAGGRNSTHQPTDQPTSRSGTGAMQVLLRCKDRLPSTPAHALGTAIFSFNRAVPTAVCPPRRTGRLTGWPTRSCFPAVALPSSQTMPLRLPD